MNNKSFAQTQRAVQSHELIACLHPRLVRWFHETFAAFTHVQLLCVPGRPGSAIYSAHLATTGSGKTLAGFLGVFDFLLHKIDNQDALDGVQCIYVSPLRALAYDIEKNLRAPIVGILTSVAA